MSSATTAIVMTPTGIIIRGTSVWSMGQASMTTTIIDQYGFEADSTA